MPNTMILNAPAQGLVRSLSSRFASEITSRSTSVSSQSQFTRTDKQNDFQ